MENFTLDSLIELPLFQGIGKNELNQFSTDIPFFLKHYEKGETISQQDSPCQQLILVFKGTLLAQTSSDNNRYIFKERLQAPLAIQPEALYGIYPHYTQMCIAQTEAHALVIPKEGVTKLFRHFEVFRLNMVNLLSTQIYRSRKGLWQNQSGSTEKRIIRFLLVHSSYPAGEKELQISMEHLGQQINEPRMNVSRALNRLQQRNLILLRRKK